MKKNPKVLIRPFFLTFIFLSLFHFHDPSCCETQSKVDSLYLFFIDLESLICPLCLHSIEGVLDDLKKKNPEKIIGIVVCDKSILLDGKNRRIIQRQIKGFKTGFDLSFPVYFDSHSHFSSFHGNGASIIELNTASNPSESLYPVRIDREK